MLQVHLLHSVVPAAGPRTPVVPLAPSVERLAGCVRPLVLVGGGGRGGGAVVFSPSELKFSHLPPFAMCLLLTLWKRRQKEPIFFL